MGYGNNGIFNVCLLNQFSADLVKFPEEILTGKLHFLCCEKPLQPAFNKLTAVVTLRGNSVFQAPLTGFYEIPIALIYFQMVRKVFYYQGSRQAPCFQK